MPYARVSVMPQPPGAADDSGNESRKGSQQQPQAAGITMQDLKKQTAHRLAQEQQRKVSKGRGFRRGGGGGGGSSSDKSSDGKNGKDTSDPVATPTKAKSKSKSSRKSSSSRKWTWDMSTDSSSKSSNGDEERSTSTTSSSGRKKEKGSNKDKDKNKNSREESSPLFNRSSQQQSSSSSGYSVFSTPRNYFRSSRQNQNGYSSKTKSKLPHGLTVHELKEMTKARLAAEQLSGTSKGTEPAEAPAPSPSSSLQQALNTLSKNGTVNVNVNNQGSGTPRINHQAPHPGQYSHSSSPAPPAILHSPVSSPYHQHHMNNVNVNHNHASYYSPNPSPKPAAENGANLYVSPWQHAQQQQTLPGNVNVPNTAPSGKSKHANNNNNQDILRTKSFPSLSTSGQDLVDTFERNSSFFEGFSSVPTSPAVPHRVIHGDGIPTPNYLAARNANMNRMGPPPPPGMSSNSNRDSDMNSNIMPEWVAESVLVTPSAGEFSNRKLFQQTRSNGDDVFRTLDPKNSNRSNNSLQQMQSSLANYSFGSVSLGAIGSSGSMCDAMNRPRLNSGSTTLSNEFASLLRLNPDDVTAEQRSMFAFSSAALPTTTEEMNDVSNRQHRSYTLE